MRGGDLVEPPNVVGHCVRYKAGTLCNPRRAQGRCQRVRRGPCGTPVAQEGPRKDRHGWPTFVHSPIRRKSHAHRWFDQLQLNARDGKISNNDIAMFVNASIEYRNQTLRSRETPSYRHQVLATKQVCRNSSVVRPIMRKHASRAHIRKVLNG